MALALAKLQKFSSVKMQALNSFAKRMKELTSEGRVYMHPSTVVKDGISVAVEVPVPNDPGAYGELKELQEEITRIDNQIESIFSSTTGVCKHTLQSLQEEQQIQAA